MFKAINLLLISFMLVLAVLPAWAQDSPDLTETFVSADGRFSFQYPTGGEVMEWDERSYPDWHSGYYKWYSTIYMSIPYETDETPSVFSGVGLIIEPFMVRLPGPSPTISDNVTEIVDFFSYNLRRDENHQVKNTWQDIKTVQVDDHTIAYTCNCDQAEYMTSYFWAVSLGNGIYFVFEPWENTSANLEAYETLFIDMLSTMQFEQETVLTIDFPEPNTNVEGALWIIERDIRVASIAANDLDQIYTLTNVSTVDGMRTGLVILDKDGHVITAITNPQMSYPNDIAIAEDGSFWMVGTFRLYHFDLEGNLIEEITIGGGEQQIEFDDMGNIYLFSHPFESRYVSVDIYDPDGILINSIDLSPPYVPDEPDTIPEFDSYIGYAPSLAVTPDQTIYVGSPISGRIRAYDIEGNLVEDDLVNQLTADFPPDTYEGIYFFQYEQGLFHIVPYSNDSIESGIYSYTEDGELVSYVPTGQISTIDRWHPFTVLSDGSVVRIDSNSILRLAPAE